MRIPAHTVTVFAIPKMDCPSEERMIRMALDGSDGIANLRFDLGGRTLTVVHSGDAAPLLARLEPLGLGAAIAERREAADGELASAGGDAAAETGTLRILLAINAVMFLVEVAAGWLADSSGLIADALDMLADATVYGLSLYAVGRPHAAKLRAAHTSGWFQAALAIGVLVDAVRRLVLGSAPEPPGIIGVSLLALAANVACMVLIARHREGGAHMKASWIFSTNDVLANIGVMLAGALVAWTSSRVPDLAAGVAVGVLVLVGAVRILRLR